MRTKESVAGREKWPAELGPFRTLSTLLPLYATQLHCYSPSDGGVPSLLHSHLFGLCSLSFTFLSSGMFWLRCSLESVSVSVFLGASSFSSPHFCNSCIL